MSLGFNPTIEHIPKEKKSFIITIHPKDDEANPRRYRTTNMISSYGAEPEVEAPAFSKPLRLRKMIHRKVQPLC